MLHHELNECFADNPLVGIIVVRDCTVIWCNERAAADLGRSSPEHIIGSSIHPLFFDENLFHKIVTELKSGDAADNDPDSRYSYENLCGETELVDAEGCKKVFRLCCRKTNETDEEHVLFLCNVDRYHQMQAHFDDILTDLEEAKLVQEEQSRRLSEMLIELEAAEKVKLEKEKMKGVLEMAVAAAHEISQPLQCAAGDLSFLKTEITGDEDVSDALDSLSDAFETIGNVVSKIRNITSCRSSEYGKNVRMIDIDESSGE